MYGKCMYGKIEKISSNQSKCMVFSQIRGIVGQVLDSSLLSQVVLISIKRTLCSISLKIKLKKNCKIFYIAFLQHRVELRGPVKKNLMKSDKEQQVGHRSSYMLVKCVLGAKGPFTLAS